MPQEADKAGLGLLPPLCLQETKHPVSLLHPTAVSGSPFENPVFTSHFLLISKMTVLYSEVGRTFAKHLDYAGPGWQNAISSQGQALGAVVERTLGMLASCIRVPEVQTKTLQCEGRTQPLVCLP